MFNFKKMKKYFEKQGVKQKYVAMQTGISEATLSLIMKGKRKCSLEEYVKLCRFAKCTFDYFIENNTEEKKGA